MTCGFINDMKNLADFTGALKNLKICILRDFLSKAYNVELDNYRGVMCHGTKGNKIVREKLTCDLKNDIRNLVNFHWSSQ